MAGAPLTFEQIQATLKRLAKKGMLNEVGPGIYEPTELGRIAVANQDTTKTLN